MTRSSRLLHLMQALRRRRRPVAAAVLAEELGVSLRTIYRDIATLAAQGAPVVGEAGLGYLLRPGFFLPPLMFDAEETDALMLGLRLAAVRGDAALAQGAENALAKITAVLPPPGRAAAEESGLIVAGQTEAAAALPVIRAALRAEVKLRLVYRDATGAASDRVVWPVVLGFFAEAEVLAAWCELRRDFRHFRLDRISLATPMQERLPRRRRVLLAEWRAGRGDGPDC